MGTRSLKVGVSRARWEAKAAGLGAAGGRGVLEGRQAYSHSVMWVTPPGARTGPQDQGRMRLVSGPRG